MPAGLVERAHTPAFLQGVALGFRAPQMVADLVAPRLRVGKQSDKYRKFGKDGFYEHDATWAPGAIPNVIKTEWSEDTFFAELRKLRHPLLDHEVINADEGLDLRVRYTERTTMAVQIAREKRVATLLTTAGNFAAGHVLAKAGGTEWNAAGVINTVQPITDIEAQIAKITAAVPGTPRGMITVVIPTEVFDKSIRHNSAIRDYYKYTQAGVVTEQIFAQLLGVKQVLIATGQTAGPGPQNAGNDIITGITMSYLWGDNVWIGIVDESENDLMMSFARSFWWAEATGGQEYRVKQYRMPDEGQEGDYIETAEAVGEKVVANFAGALITNTLA